MWVVTCNHRGVTYFADDEWDDTRMLCEAERFSSDSDAVKCASALRRQRPPCVRQVREAGMTSRAKLYEIDSDDMVTDAHLGGRNTGRGEVLRELVRATQCMEKIDDRALADVIGDIIASLPKPEHVGYLDLSLGQCEMSGNDAPCPDGRNVFDSEDDDSLISVFQSCDASRIVTITTTRPDGKIGNQIEIALDSLTAWRVASAMMGDREPSLDLRISASRRLSMIADAEPGTAGDLIKSLECDGFCVVFGEGGAPRAENRGEPVHASPVSFRDGRPA